MQMGTRSWRVHSSLFGRARRFRDLLADARAVQEQVLLRLLSHNRRCDYGRRYGFDQIRSSADFARRVPIVTYDELQPDIARMSAGESGVLVTEPVLMFEETGGSSGGRKLVPYTATSLEGFRAGLLPWMDDLFTTYPTALDGSAYWSISPAARAARRTEGGGIPIGMDNDASYFGEDLAGWIAQSLSVPPTVGGLTDIEQWRQATACSLLADETLAFMSIWSPTFLLELISYMEAHAAELQVGRIADLFENGRLNCSRAWPRLHLISCWDQGSSRLHAGRLKERFPTAVVQGKGLLATEGLISIPLADCPWPVLAVESGYFEFLADDGETVCAADVRVGEEYEVLMTNHSGLYRYRIGDRVLVRERRGQAPALEFLGRAGLGADLVGEKLTEEFVIRVLGRLSVAGFGCLAADARGYVLLVEEAGDAGSRGVGAGSPGVGDGSRVLDELGRSCDLLLADNPQYAHARALNQLEPVKSICCPRLGERLTRAAVMNGQRLGDIKPPALLVGDWRTLLAM